MTTPPTSAEIDTWFAAWMNSSLPVLMAGGSFPWGETLTLIVVAWTTNAGTPSYQMMNPAATNVDNAAVPAADPVLMHGLNDCYGVSVRVYEYPLPSLPSPASIAASSAVQATYNNPANWCTAT